MFSDLESACTASDSGISGCDEDLSKEKAFAEHTSNHLIQKPRIDPRIISDATIGLSDGLTVPFALTAGLSTLGNTKFVIFGGLAELTAGAISMGLGGYLASKAETEAHQATLNSTQSLIHNSASSTASLIRSTFDDFDLPPELLDALSGHLASKPAKTQLDFLMRFHHSSPSEPGGTSRAYVSALTIALGYFIGGFTPLLPYLVVPSAEVSRAFWCSVIITAMALFTFGAVKTVLVGGVGGKEVRKWMGGGVQMVWLGGVAAGASMALVRAFGTE